jgi:tripartite-type tricarboxylate transporter receptor subunit TctC
MIKRRLFAAGLVATPFVKPAFAQAWQPSGPIKMVVAYPAGGPTDAIARIVAADISGPLGQQVVVENVSGASGAPSPKRGRTGSPSRSATTRRMATTCSC